MNKENKKNEINGYMLDGIRSASRLLVRKFGYMNRTIAGTSYSPSAVHALIEIGYESVLSGKELTERLYLEKSSVSRLVQNLIKSGEVEEQKSDQDARQKDLMLTVQGKRTLDNINNFGVSQVSAALGPLDEKSRQTILKGLELYSNALEPDVKATAIAIHEGYKPGLIGAIAGYHGTIHNQLGGLGLKFEAMVATGMSEFMPRTENINNKTWYAEQGGKIIGGITIDGEDLGNNIAHLRWFIIDNSLQSAGLGSRFMKKAMDFCDDRGFNEVHLWTYKGLDAAKNLYEKNGFSLAEEEKNDLWGKRLIVQKYVRG